MRIPLLSCLLSFLFLFTHAYSENATDYTDFQERIILEKHSVNGINTLSQRMFRKENVSYVIQNDYQLVENITIPNNCELIFDGGSIGGKYIIKGDNTYVCAGNNQIFGSELKFDGLWRSNEAYSEWFGKTDDIDATDVINKALTIFKRVQLTPKTYIVNGTINLSGHLCLLLSHGTRILKTDNNTNPVISITGGMNSLLGESKSSIIESNSLTPYGLVSLGDFKETICKTTVFYNKIDNITLRGCQKNSKTVQSIGLRFKHVYKERGKLYATYYNSFTNLWFEYFNIGLNFKGDVNANFIRDVVFAYCGTGDFVTDAGITFESDTFYPDGGTCSVYENSVSDIFVTGAWKQNGAACLCLKGKIAYNSFNIQGENGNKGYGLRVVGEQSEISNNIFNTDFVQYLGDKNTEGLYDNNIWLDGRGIGTPTMKTHSLTTNAIKGDFIIDKNSFYKDSYFNYSCRLGYMTADKPYMLFSYDFINNKNANEIIKYQLCLYSPNGNCNGIIDASILLKNGMVAYYDVPIVDGLQILKPVIKNNRIYILAKPNIISGNGITKAEAFLTIEITSGRTGSEKIIDAIHVATVDSKDNLIQYNGEVEKANVAKAGGIKNRPTFPIDGLSFLETTTTGSKPVWFYSNNWYEYDGTKAGINRSGPYNSKPNSNDIPLGFQYFCTDRKTPEGNANGIIIYNRGEGVWVDALGRVIK